MTAQLVEGFASAPVFFALVRGQLQGHHRNLKLECMRQSTRIVLNQFCGTRRTDQQGSGFEARNGLTRCIFKQLCGIATQIAGLEGGVSDGRPSGQTLNHGEQQVGVGIALRCVQDVMHVLHGRCNAHGPNVWGSFVSPKRELHGLIPKRPAFRDDGGGD